VPDFATAGVLRVDAALSFFVGALEEGCFPGVTVTCFVGVPPVFFTDGVAAFFVDDPAACFATGAAARLGGVPAARLTLPDGARSLVMRSVLPIAT